MANWADRLAALAQALGATGTVPDTSLATAETDTLLRLAPDGAGGVEFAPGGGEVFVATPADTAINSVTDVTIVSTNVAGLAAGDQLIVDAVFVILNTSGSSRIYNVSLDFDGQFPAEMITYGATIGAIRGHPFHVRGVLDVRSTSLAYAEAQLEGGPSPGTDDAANSTMSTTTNMAMVWGSAAADLSGTVTVALLIRSAAATATQTLRLHSFTIRKVTP